MEPDRLAFLSRRYARYSRSLPGLSLTLGSVVVVLWAITPPFLMNHLSAHPENGWSLMALITASVLAGWILLKEWLRQRIYLSLGIAEAPGSAAEIRLNRALAAVISLLTLAYPVKAMVDPVAALPPPTPMQVCLGLAACFAMPWCTIRFIRGLAEGLLWVVLCYWALVCMWGFPLGADPHGGAVTGLIILALALTYFGGLIVGLVQHFNFMRLAREIRNQGTAGE